MEITHPTIKAKANKAERSWMLYDLTTNAYATIILTAIFPIYFNAVVGHSVLGLELKGFASSFVMLLTAFLCPILGAVGDLPGKKKRYWAIFAFSGAALTLGLVFASGWQLLLLFFVLSNIAYNCAFLFYDSFITDVTTPERMHRVSTQGFAVGYIGGGLVTLIISAVLLFTMGTSNPLAVKLSFLLTALWWFVFNIPMLRNVKQVHSNPRGLDRGLFRELWATLKDIWADKGLRFYVLAYFFYIDGVSTVITMATSYGSALGLSSSMMILALILTQTVAAPFSIIFGRLATRFNAIRMLLIAIAIYVIICILGFEMGRMIETAPSGPAHGLAISHGQMIFWIVAFMVGMVQGGIQALSRSQFARMIPTERSNEYFGFFNIFNRFASILGPALMAVTTLMTGFSSFGILSLIILFFLGALLLLGGRKHFQEAN
ncbi:MFS transporter [Lactococcus termiticola]|uniref:Major facilitator superfamily transporter n=1 Tax=Lactococcus termiticola TaxID=2169526 RepID=A0A2R5HF88_9LACT|nr:MFS transporter [Lactococcus termiticola]GBG96704.1 major facilitator superfamily transporter [Lactococcus termiticola]